MSMGLRLAALRAAGAPLLFLRIGQQLKFKERHVSIVQRSSSVVNLFTSSVKLIQANGEKVKTFIQFKTSKS